MLSFVMVTHNEGPEFKDRLEALAKVMERGDRIIALDRGSTDDTPRVLAAFSEVVGLESILLSQGEAFALGIGIARTNYVMLLGTQDRLNAQSLQKLRQNLEDAAPVLALINCGWWYGDPSQHIRRTDAARVQALPKQGDISLLYGLCPDPQRLVLAREAWVTHRAALAAAGGGHQLYTAVIERGEECLFVQNTVSLQPFVSRDPAPLIAALGVCIMDLPRSLQNISLRARLIWADDAVTYTHANQGAALLGALEAFSKSLPRRLRGLLYRHDGPAGALWRARRDGGQKEALLCFAQMALATQQRHNSLLIAQIEKLQKELQEVQPLPAHLQAIYDRMREL